MKEDDTKDLIRTICEERARSAIATARQEIIDVAEAFLEELGVGSEMSVEDLLNACAQASGMEHPATRAAIAKLAEHLERDAVVTALDALAAGGKAEKPKAKAKA